jgi:hypothetical protein
MRAPAHYGGTVTVPGKFHEIADKIDPQQWCIMFPSIWNQSYYANDKLGTYFLEPAPQPAKKKAKKATKAAKGAVGLKPSTGVKPISRAKDPVRLGRVGLPNPGNPNPTPEPNHEILVPPPSGTNQFFEDVIFGGFQYRNLLKVKYAETLRKGTRIGVSYKYGQIGCLTTKALPNAQNGGIDVDSGTASVTDNGNSTVTVTITKQVRFTQPVELEPDMNDLAHVFVPVSLDAWLHNLVFTT